MNTVTDDKIKTLLAELKKRISILEENARISDMEIIELQREVDRLHGRTS
jgi:hypothetical protein